MLDKKVSVLIVFVSVFVCNFAIAKHPCGSHVPFDESQLEGTWNYVAEVSSKPDKVRCPHLVLKREGEGKFSGYKYGYHGSKIRNVTMNLAVTGNDVVITFPTPKGDVKVPMVISSCDGKTEFVLECPKRNLYLIFGKYKVISKKLMHKYRSLANDSGLKMDRKINKKCIE